MQSSEAYQGHYQKPIRVAVAAAANHTAHAGMAGMVVSRLCSAKATPVVVIGGKHANLLPTQQRRLQRHFPLLMAYSHDTRQDG